MLRFVAPVVLIVGLVPVRLTFAELSDVVAALRVIVLPAPPLSAAIVTLPVLTSPSVKFCLFVVPSMPVPVRYVELFPLLAEILAIGVPLFTLITANFAEEVDVPPNARSRVVLIGCNCPDATFHQLVVSPSPQFWNVGALDPLLVRHCPATPVPVKVSVLLAPYAIPPLVKLLPTTFVTAPE